MGDRFYLGRDNLTIGLQPDRKPKTPGTPTYYKNNPTPMYPIPGKVYQFNGVEKVYSKETGWREVNVKAMTFPENPKTGQVVKQNNQTFVFLAKQGWVNTVSLVF